MTGLPFIHRNAYNAASCLSLKNGPKSFNFLIAKKLSHFYMSSSDWNKLSICINYMPIVDMFQFYFGTKKKELGNSIVIRIRV